MNALLQYVANQLKSSESLDLLVLKEMVQTMTVRRLGCVAGCRGRGSRHQEDSKVWLSLRVMAVGRCVEYQGSGLPASCALPAHLLCTSLHCRTTYV